MDIRDERDTQHDNYYTMDMIFIDDQNMQRLRKKKNQTKSEICA